MYLNCDKSEFTNFNIHHGDTMGIIAYSIRQLYCKRQDPLIIADWPHKSTSKPYPIVWCVIKQDSNTTINNYVCITCTTFMDSLCFNCDVTSCILASSKAYLACSGQMSHNIFIFPEIKHTSPYWTRLILELPSPHVPNQSGQTRPISFLLP